MKIAIVVWAIVVVLGVFGYVRNVLKLTQCDFASPYKCEALHGAGLVAPPLGAVMGFVEVGR